MGQIHGQLFRATSSLVIYPRYFLLCRVLVVYLETQVLLVDLVHWYVIRTHLLKCNCLVFFVLCYGLVGI